MCCFPATMFPPPEIFRERSHGQGLSVMRDPFSSTISEGHSKYLVGPTVHTKTYIFTYFCQHYWVLFTMPPVIESHGGGGQPPPPGSFPPDHYSMVMYTYYILC